MSSSKPLHTYHRRSKSKSTDRVDFNPSIPRVPRTRSSSSVPVRDSSPLCLMRLPPSLMRLSQRENSFLRGITSLMLFPWRLKSLQIRFWSTTTFKP
ncbi:unnamed protein product [Prunus armeniaca]|uniref:Uncharacterized protein n=1 Tax=Prunus armeniaca TaxID=36596 RepID=A0A6J5WTU1_PRUAR|nr:unnamed protein product [Prunus armeniaca]